MTPDGRECSRAPSRGAPPTPRRPAGLPTDTGGNSPGSTETIGGAWEMSNDRTVFASVLKDTGRKLPVRRPPVPKASASKKADAPKAPIELDMGEGSREQGFLLNGCR